MTQIEVVKVLKSLIESFQEEKEKLKREVKAAFPSGDVAYCFVKINFYSEKILVLSAILQEYNIIYNDEGLDYVE